MTRREFVSLAGGTAVAWPLMAQAQRQTVPIPRIAYLGASSPAILDPRQIEQFKVGLTENGLIEGQNIQVDYLWGEGSPDRLRQHAADLAKRNLSVIVTAGPQPVRALLEAKVSSPIVFAILSDPISDGFVQSRARPGGNLTGLSMVGTDLESKRLQILKDGVPTVTKVMLLHDPTMGSTIGLEEAKSSARGLGLDILVGEVADVDKLANIFTEAVRQNVNGVAGLAGGERSRQHGERVSVRCGMRRLGRRNRAGGSGFVFHHDRLSEPSGQAFTDDARYGVNRTACRKADH